MLMSYKGDLILIVNFSVLHRTFIGVNKYLFLLYRSVLNYCVGHYLLFKIRDN